MHRRNYSLIPNAAFSAESDQVDISRSLSSCTGFNVTFHFWLHVAWADLCSLCLYPQPPLHRSPAALTLLIKHTNLIRSFTDKLFHVKFAVTSWSTAQAKNVLSCNLTGKCWLTLSSALRVCFDHCLQKDGQHASTSKVNPKKILITPCGRATVRTFTCKINFP